ncbi:MAG: ABC transporter permease [Terriglobales bacterium]
MGTLWQDLRYGWRMLVKNPGLSLIAIASLALAIGANTAIFTVWNAVFLRSVPVTEPNRVVNLYTLDQGNRGIAGFTYLGLSMPNYSDYAAEPGVYAGLAAFQNVGASMRFGNQVDQVQVEMASGNYFQVLGVGAAAGRVFTVAEAAADGQGALAVLDFDFWRRRFGGDPGIIGQAIALNGRSFMVTGVAAADFHGTQRLGAVDLWAPITMHDALLTGQFKGYFSQRRPRMSNAVGRLAPGVTLAQAQAAVRAEAQQLARQYPADNRAQSAVLVPLPESAVNPNARPVF